MLTTNDPRVDALRAQRESAVVTGLCGCGCASIGIEVDRTNGTPADLGSSAISADMKEEIDGTPIDPHATVGLLMWLDEGWLSYLEIWWIDEIPAEFPPPSSFEQLQVRC
jgi:hypothetical protein